MAFITRYDVPGGGDVEECSNGYYVRHTDHVVYLNEMLLDRDAQRLRADTAEADSIRKDGVIEDLMQSNSDMTTCLADAEQCIAELSADNQLLRKLLEQTLAALNPTAKLSKSIRAALNRKPEAGSHD